MQRRLRYSLVLALLIALMADYGVARAEVPYRTFSYDTQNREFFVQPAYIPISYIGYNIVPGGPDSPEPTNLNEPADIFIDDRDHIYIADTKNNRIIHLDNNQNLVKIVGDKDGPGKLTEPNGVYVHKDNTIYVADTGNKRIVVFSPSGEFVREYTRPDTPLLDESFSFEPTKLVVDKRGFLYVATNNGYQGLIVMDGDKGEFQGFFGANKVPFNLIDYLKRKFFTEDQLAKEIKKLPGSVSNVAIDSDGLIYTTSISVAQGHIKKLNFSGKDLLGEKVYGPKYVTLNEERLFVDVAVDRMGNISGIEAHSGVIYQYDALGDLLFAFGGKNEGFNKLGLFNYPSSIEVDSKGNMYIVDRTASLIQIFRPTEFANLVHKATELFMLGKYEESEGPWKEVLHLNSRFYKAHLGLAKSYYRKRQFDRAMEEFRLAGDPTGYSEAFWQVRLLWIQKNFSKYMTGAIILFVVYLLARYLLRKFIARRKQYGHTGGTTDARAAHTTASR